MIVDVIYDTGKTMTFVLPEDISMIAACERFAQFGKVAKVEFLPLDTPV